MKATILDGFKRGLMNAWRASLFNAISVTDAILAQGWGNMPSNPSCREQWWETVIDAMNMAVGKHQETLEDVGHRWAMVHGFMQFKSQTVND